MSAQDAKNALITALEDGLGRLERHEEPSPRMVAGGPLPAWLAAVLQQAVAYFGPQLAQAAITFLQQFVQPKPSPDV